MFTLFCIEFLTIYSIINYLVKNLSFTMNNDLDFFVYTIMFKISTKETKSTLDVKLFGTIQNYFFVCLGHLGCRAAFCREWHIAIKSRSSLILKVRIMNLGASALLCKLIVSRLVV
jgi:hypothetical protein